MTEKDYQSTLGSSMEVKEESISNPSLSIKHPCEQRMGQVGESRFDISDALPNIEHRY